jgi:hypothetical protein
MALKQDRLEEQNRFLTQRTVELEAIVAQEPRSSSLNRGGVASRGSFLLQKKKETRRLARGDRRPELDDAAAEEIPLPDSGSDDGSARDTGSHNTGVNSHHPTGDTLNKPRAYLGGAVKDLDPAFKVARSALQVSS